MPTKIPRRQPITNIVVGVPQRRPHKSFRRTFREGQWVTFPRAVAVKLARTALADVRFLAEHELSGIASEESTTLQFAEDDTPEPQSFAGGV